MSRSEGRITGTIGESSGISSAQLGELKKRIGQLVPHTRSERSEDIALASTCWSTAISANPEHGSGLH